MVVREVWRYPVKSMGGERLESVECGVHGIEGDRSWGLVDRETGLVLTARREPRLLYLSARYRPGERPEIIDGDGRPVDDDRALEDRLGRRVALVPAGNGTATFESPLTVDDASGEERDWVRWESTSDTFHDGRSTVSLVTESELGSWDRRRFRSNIVISDGTGSWQAGTVMVGGATLRVRGPIDRCVMVTRAQPGLAADREVLRRLVAEHGNRLGTGAVVAAPGRVTVGDRVGTASH